MTPFLLTYFKLQAWYFLFITKCSGFFLSFFSIFHFSNSTFLLIFSNLFFSASVSSLLSWDFPDFFFYILCSSFFFVYFFHHHLFLYCECLPRSFFYYQILRYLIFSSVFFAVISFIVQLSGVPLCAFHYFPFFLIAR